MFEFINVVIYLSIYVGLVATAFFIISSFGHAKKRKPLYRDHELPRVSVIIPAYNEEGTISETIQSAVKSDYPEDKFEVIVVDDGSTDGTLKLARRFMGGRVRIFHKKNGGKGSALNVGIREASGEIIFTMDADTSIHSGSIKKMVRPFKNEKIMSVTSAMLIKKPKTILQRIQNVEYLWGLFLRRAFASVDSIYVAPGAFSAYRKKFFDLHGGYDEDNVTEDLEIALRIQMNGYGIENCPDAPVYTSSPEKFRGLLVQRRRWYYGTIKNLVNYRRMISPKYGDLGAFIIPVGIVSTLSLIFILIYSLVNSAIEMTKEFAFLQSINFDLSGFFELNFRVVERFFFLYASDPLTTLVLISLAIMSFYVFYVLKASGKTRETLPDMALFFLFFSFLYGFWWIVSIIYSLFVRKIKWR